MSHSADSNPDTKQTSVSSAEPSIASLATQLQALETSLKQDLDRVRDEMRALDERFNPIEVSVGKEVLEAFEEYLRLTGRW